MYVSRIRVCGLKCFGGPREVDLEVDPEPGWTVLAGPNGSGKSTLLHAVALALGACSATPASHWLAPGHDDAWAEASPAPRWRLSELAEPPAQARTPLALHLGGAPVALVPELLREGILPDGWRVTDPVRHHVARGGLEVPLAELGDGVAALAVLVSEVAGRPSGPVLIDDVERHLHPVWQQRIGSWLTERFPEAQFLVATHSPYVCQAADPGALVHLPAAESGRPPYRIDEAVQQRILYGSGDDAAVSELFGLPSSYSPAAEAERRLLVRLERKLYAGLASDAELAEYRELGAKLNSSLGARADEVAARLLGREP
ncbi:AAA family ATPase [Kitasatospora cinereorecta]|uniref:AAA family ATPase n=1 Tax=Kitasatospora cinereorecta TaxID=285560 RepID=A0ABW0VFS8_9ACTN